MSEATIRLAELGMEAFNRRDAECLIEITTDDFVWMPALPAALGETEYVGHSGIRRYFADIEGVWEELTVLGDELRDVGDRVLSLGRLSGRGSGSGVLVEIPIAFILEFRGSKLSKASSYLDRSEALKALGLEK